MEKHTTTYTSVRLTTAVYAQLKGSIAERSKLLGRPISANEMLQHLIEKHYELAR